MSKDFIEDTLKELKQADLSADRFKAYEHLMRANVYATLGNIQSRELLWGKGRVFVTDRFGDNPVTIEEFEK